MRLLLSCILGAVQSLPQALAVRLGCLIGWLLWVVRFRRGIVQNQLQVALGAEKEEAELRQIARDHYRHLGLLLVEVLRLPLVTVEVLDRTVTFEGKEIMEEALAQGKGVISISAHCGNWELCGIDVARQGWPINAIGKEMKSRAGEMLRHMVRDDNGIPTIPRRNSMRRILKALRNNEIVVFMIDQNMTDDEGVFVDFFGYPACTTNAVAVVAERTGAPVIPFCAWRDADLRRHHCRFLPPVPLVKSATEDPATAQQADTAAYTRIMEEAIREHPAQWMWIHKRWKTRPLDETEHPFVYSQSPKVHNA